MKKHLSTIISTILFTGLFLIPMAQFSHSQSNVSLGCCKTVEGTAACVGCGDGGLRCSVDGQLCPETSSFTLGEVCAESPVAGEAECYPPQVPTGCCVQSKQKCSDNTDIDSCTGQHWFEGASCSEVPACVAAPDTTNFLDYVILGAVFAIVAILLMKFRRKRHGS